MLLCEMHTQKYSTDIKTIFEPYVLVLYAIAHSA